MQHFFLIYKLLPAKCEVGYGTNGKIFTFGSNGPTAHAPSLGGRQLACFHQVLETIKVFFDLSLGVFTEEFHNERAELSRGRGVFERDFDFSAASIRGLFETHRARVWDMSAFEGAPGDQFVRGFVDDFRIPFDGHPGGQAGDPVRAAAGMTADRADRFQMVQKTWQILEVMPEPEQLFRRLIDGDALFDLDARAVLDARAKPFALRCADAQGLIETGMACRAAIDQTGAGDHHQQSAQTSTLQTVNRQGAAASS